MQWMNTRTAPEVIVRFRKGRGLQAVARSRGNGDRASNAYFPCFAQDLGRAMTEFGKCKVAVGINHDPYLQVNAASQLLNRLQPIQPTLSSAICSLKNRG